MKKNPTKPRKSSNPARHFLATVGKDWTPSAYTTDQLHTVAATDGYKIKTRRTTDGKLEVRRP